MIRLFVFLSLTTSSALAQVPAIMPGPTLLTQQYEICTHHRKDRTTWMPGFGPDGADCGAIHKAWRTEQDALSARLQSSPSDDLSKLNALKNKQER